MAQGVTQRDIISTNGSGVAKSNITSKNLGGVSLQPTQATGTFNTRVVNNRTVINNNTTVNYITNVGYANNCWNGGWNGGWGCRPVYGPGSCWSTCGGSSGWSFGVGFGTGAFSFGFFYGANNAPLCSSWCNPWWDGWSGFVSVGCWPSWGWCRPCWSPCGGPWWSNYVVYTGYPTWCVPVYSYTPICAVPSVSYVNYYVDDPAPAVAVTTAPAIASAPPSVITGVPSAAVATSAAESEAWDLLSNGFPRSAGESFARLNDADPGNVRALAGYGIALAMLDDIPAAATVLRNVAAADPNAIAMLPIGPSLRQRIELLENSAEVASRQASTARDALFVLATWRTALGQYSEAHFALVIAQQQGDSSAGAAALRGWLDTRLGPRA